MLCLSWLRPLAHSELVTEEEGRDCPDGIARSYSPPLQLGIKSVFFLIHWILKPKLVTSGKREMSECGGRYQVLSELFPIFKMFFPHLNLPYAWHSAGSDDTESRIWEWNVGLVYEPFPQDSRKGN